MGETITHSRKNDTCFYKSTYKEKTGKDIIAQAQSGTGKTGAFLIGVLQNLDMSIEWYPSFNQSPLHENYLYKHIIFVIP